MLLNTTVKTTNNAVNVCFNTIYANVRNYANAFCAALTAQNIAVQKNLHSYYAHLCTNVAQVIIKNKAQMQQAIAIAKQIAKQHKMQIVRITTKQKSIKVLFYAFNTYYKTLFTTKCNSKTHTVAKAQIVNAVLAAVKKYATAINNLNTVQAKYIVLQANTIYVNTQSNKQRIVANLLKKVLVKHNVNATVIQHRQFFNIKIKNFNANN